MSVRIPMDADQCSLQSLRARLFEARARNESLELKASEAIDVLSAFQAGAIDGPAVAAWAEFFDGNEDVDFEQGFEDVMPDMLFELASPEINGELTPARASVLMETLKRKPGSENN